MLIRPAIGDTDPIRYRRPTPDGQFSGNIIDEAMRPPFGVGPSGRTGSGHWIDRLPVVLLLKLYRADIAESGMEPSGIVDAVDELGKIFDDVGECLERHWIDALDLQRLHEAFCLGVVVRISSPTHGPFDAVIGEVVAVGLGSILGSSIGMMDATRRRLSPLNRGGKGSERQPRVDGTADGIAHDAPGPGIQNDGNIDEATDDGDVGGIGDPKLVGSVQDDVLSKVWKDRLVVIAVGRCRETTSHSGLKVMLAHKTADLLVIDHTALMPEGGLNPSPAIVLELVADSSHRRDDGGVVSRTDRFVVEGGAGYSHQPAPFGKADAAGPTIADVVSLLGRGLG